MINITILFAGFFLFLCIIEKEKGGDREDAEKGILILNRKYLIPLFISSIVWISRTKNEFLDMHVK